MADHGVVCSMSRSGNVWDNAAMESFFSSLQTERTARKTYRTRDEARTDVLDYIERFYNGKRRQSRLDSQPYVVRGEGRISLSGCHPNRVQARPHSFPRKHRRATPRTRLFKLWELISPHYRRHRQAPQLCQY